jgi:hypothetical protein
MPLHVYCKNLLTANKATMSNKCISQTRKELERYATYRQINRKDMPHMDRSMEKICHI